MRFRDSKWLATNRRRFWAALFSIAVCIVLIVTLSWHYTRNSPDSHRRPASGPGPGTPSGSGGEKGGDLIWRTLKWNYPLDKPRALPTPDAAPLPAVQFKFGKESDEDKKTRVGRQDAVKKAFQRCWGSYKDKAWLHDELKPVSGGFKEAFGGWAATLIDALDTMWIMGLHDDFHEAVGAVDKNISFASSASGNVINLFETNIRYLGGLVAAYDLSGDERLKAKARDAGDMILKAFDTPNHLPVARWNIKDAAENKPQTASFATNLAEIGTLVLEFTRLSLITGDAKYYDVTQHISDLLDASQAKTKLPGLWSIDVDASEARFDKGFTYSLGAQSDSAYEYFPKMMALTGSLDPVYERLYKRSMAAAQEHILFRPMVPSEADILLPGSAMATGDSDNATSNLSPSGSHLACFAGGMFALGGRLTANESHVDVGRRLADGCVWAYNATQSGIMPEGFGAVPCADRTHCAWNETAWRGAAGGSEDGKRPPRGMTGLSAEYILRPEAIESVFIMYRVTGDRAWQDKAWAMWQAIDGATRTELANSAVSNVDDSSGGEKKDSMESFWLAETLKYFYLVFAEPDVVSLDEWVLNTEAHPFKRMTAK